MNPEIESISLPNASIKVVGIGGGGGNAVSTMIKSGVEGVDFIALNTDIQALNLGLAPTKLQIGKELTRGLGAGADPDIGRDATLEDRHEIQQLLTGADMVFVTAGMGGGTGTGGASIVAQIARELGALTVGVVTKPFDFEGKRRRKYAEMGIARLRECVDTLITIPNQRLLQLATPDLTMIGAFKLADDVLVNAVKGISDIINIPGTINVDFADVKTVMSGMGLALMGIGAASGEGRAREAAIRAISSPLLEDVDIEGATGLLINISAGSKVTLLEVNEACSIIQDAAHEDANIIFGAVIDESLGDEIRVTVIATGFPSEYGEKSVVKEVKTATYFQESYNTSNISKNLGGYSSRITKPIISAPQVSSSFNTSTSRASIVQNVNTENTVASSREVVGGSINVASDNNGTNVNTSNNINETARVEKEEENNLELNSLNNNQEEVVSKGVIEEDNLNTTAFDGIASEELSFEGLGFNEGSEQIQEEQGNEEEGELSFDNEVDDSFAAEQMMGEEGGEDCLEECDCENCENYETCEYAHASDQEGEEVEEEGTETNGGSEYEGNDSNLSLDGEYKEINGASLDTAEFNSGSMNEEDSLFSQKIDEAIALAGKLEQEEKTEDNNIDVPAYLRHDIEDISLD